MQSCSEYIVGTQHGVQLIRQCWAPWALTWSLVVSIVAYGGGVALLGWRLLRKVHGR